MNPGIGLIRSSGLLVHAVVRTQLTIVNFKTILSAPAAGEIGEL